MAQRRAGASLALAWRRPDSSDSASTTGPSISTRISFTNVPICADSELIGAVAASTCGAA
jgi:hypothetical protein